MLKEQLQYTTDQIKIAAELCYDKQVHVNIDKGDEDWNAYYLYICRYYEIDDSIVIWVGRWKDHIPMEEREYFTDILLEICADKPLMDGENLGDYLRKYYIHRPVFLWRKFVR